MPFFKECARVEPDQRQLLQDWSRAHTTPQQVAKRCRIVLLSHDGCQTGALPRNWISIGTPVDCGESVSPRKEPRRFGKSRRGVVASPRTVWLRKSSKPPSKPNPKVKLTGALAHWQKPRV